jgi:hypothetical protein
MADRSGSSVCGVISNRMLSFSLGVLATVFWAEIFGNVACERGCIERNHTKEENLYLVRLPGSFASHQ